MGGYKNINKVCSFYVSSMHLVTMVIPYIKKQLDLDIGVSTFFEYNLKENAQELLSKMMSEDESKHSVLELDWGSKNSHKFSDVDKEIKEKLSRSSELNIFITGSNKYIVAINENLENFFMKNMKKLKGKYISIINCYEVTQFNDNIKEILNEHELILNTSGIHGISDVFEGYSKEVV